mgnify:CR=1 FL=1
MAQRSYPSGTARARKIYERIREGLAGHFEIEQAMELEPFEKDHEFLYLKFAGPKKSGL